MKKTSVLPMGSVLCQRYSLNKVLGQGGFGITYKATDLMLNKEIALKEYFPIDIAIRKPNQDVSPVHAKYNEIYDYGLKRFFDEAEALARFNRNLGIVAVYDFFYEHQTAYMVMQYVDGITWKEMMKESGGRMSVEAALSILIPVLDSLRAVHEVGMLHRDISPENIIILPNKQVKMIDFGAARYAVKQQQQQFSIIFKPGYTPEEQYRSQSHIGPWSDIYAIAATFYHAITGKMPIDAMNRKNKDTLIAPSRMGVRISNSMENALMKALAVQKEHRYANVDQFKRALLQPEKSIEETQTRQGTKKPPLWVWLLGFLFVMLIIRLLF